MHMKIPSDIALPDIPYNVPTLPYEEPALGGNYWIKDDFFPDAIAKDIANRCFNKEKWKLGKPYTNELWPGMRSKNALKSKELIQVEDWVKGIIRRDKLWVVKSQSVLVDNNTAILVGGKEGSARPHVDNRNLCRYAAVLYLNTIAPPHSGTSFYRLRYDNGAVGGNKVCTPHANLVDALKTSSLPTNAWYEDVTIENKFNRIILFKGDMVHSASGYFGEQKRDKRLAVTFFWMTE
jgi:hypothetical protein